MTENLTIYAYAPENKEVHLTFHRANISSARIKSPAKILRRITHKGTVPGGCSLEIFTMVCKVFRTQAINNLSF